MGWGDDREWRPILLHQSEDASKGEEDHCPQSLSSCFVKRLCKTWDSAVQEKLAKRGGRGVDRGGGNRPHSSKRRDDGLPESAGMPTSALPLCRDAEGTKVDRVGCAVRLRILHDEAPPIPAVRDSL